MSKGNFTIAEVEVSLDHSPLDKEHPEWPSGYFVCLMRETPTNAKINCGGGRKILPEDAKKLKAKILAFRKEIWSDIQKAEKNFAKNRKPGQGPTKTVRFV